MKFGEKIREQRNKRGLSMEALAKELDIGLRTIARYEQGGSYPQNREVYKKLADFFEVDVNYFLTEDEEFLTEAAAKYGRRGLSQAQAVLEQASALLAGSELSDDDKLAFVHEIQELYFDSKERARQKFTPKKYRKQ